MENIICASVIILIGIIIVASLYDRSDLYKEPVILVPKTPPLDLSPYLPDIEKFLSIIEDSRKQYFKFQLKEQIKKQFNPVYKTLNDYPNKEHLSDPIVKRFIEIFSNLDSNISAWNETYCAKEIETNKELFDNIDGKSLDMAQRKAVVVDEDNTLVIAGAGTGKTLTVSAKVKYLVDKKKVNPHEILLLSFTRKAAAEMQERISGRLGLDVEARTFHGLGLNIITRGLGNQPDVLDPNLGEMEKLIDKFFEEEIIDDPGVMQNLIEYFAYYLNIPQDLDKIKNLGEIYEDSRSLDFETLKSKAEQTISNLKTMKMTIPGERVKSLEEVAIANFLFLHGVKYTYEMKYPHNTGDPYRKHYRPDFYLQDFDIYLEHFGINEQKRVPWLSPIEEKKYLAEIKWKREIHEINGTTLIETYSFQNKNGQLVSALDTLLQSSNVEYQIVDLKEIYEKVFVQNEDRYLKEFKKLIKNFIGLFKSNGYTESDFASLYNKVARETNDFLRKRSFLFLSIVHPIYRLYQEYLDETGKIDFNDMINQATKMIRIGKVISRYKYIIVDEYQDISVSRYRLIYEMKKQSKAQIVAVGDDWQSIYRFSGSDIYLFTDIDKYFGYTEKVKIEETYRNSQQLIDSAGHFIMKNPKQIRKRLISGKHNSRPINIFFYNEDVIKPLQAVIDHIVYYFGTKKEILLLGRTNYDVNIFDDQKEFRIINNGADRIIKYDRYPNLLMTFITVHRAKGLEAENVIVLNLENSLLGFPNKIADDPVLSLVLTDEDEYEYSEERRLYYVALTRTKNNVFLMANDRNPSIFVDELRRELNIPHISLSGESSVWNNPACPRCKKGVLILRINRESGSHFLGCSNFPQCDYTVKNIEILNDKLVCVQCGGFMVRRGSDFYGCTNYPHCRNTLNTNEDYFIDDDEDDINTPF